MTVALVTLEEVKAVLPIRAGNTDFDARLERLILVATGQIEDAIHRELDEAARVETFDTSDTREQVYDFYNPTNEQGVVLQARRQRFMLKAAPVVLSAAFEVRYDPGRTYADSSVLDPSYYVLDAADGVLHLVFPTVRSLRGLRISYTGGYAATGTPPTLSESIPENLRLACITQVQFLFSKLAADNIGQDTDRSQGSVGSGRFMTTRGVTAEVAEMIAGYRRLHLGRG